MRMDARNEKKGLLWLLDEESIFPGSTTETFLKRLCDQRQGILVFACLLASLLPCLLASLLPCFLASLHACLLVFLIFFFPQGGTMLKSGTSETTFYLSHFQSRQPMLYNSRGWLKSAREHPTVKQAQALLSQSSKFGTNPPYSYQALSEVAYASTVG